MTKILNKRTDKIPVGAIYCGRPSKYGNPFSIGKDGTRAEVIAKFRIYAEARLLEEPHWLDDLRGVEAVVCWCAPLPCHTEVLIELANR